MSPEDSSSTPSASSHPEASGPRSSRRAVLAAVGTATASAVAGCNALGGDSSTAAFHDGDWPSYGNGPGNANRVAGGAPEADGHEILASAGWPYTPPVVHEGVVYFAADRQVVAVTPDGSERWSRDLDVEVSGAPALDPERNRLYVPTGIVPAPTDPWSAPAVVTVLSLSDGEVRDTHRVGDDRTYGVTVADGDVYARSATACVRLAPDGTERWRSPLESLVYDEYNLGDTTATQIAPAVTDDGVYVPDRDALVKLDPESGRERWRVPVDTPYAASVVDGDGVVQTGWQETVAVTQAGDVRWRRNLHSRAAAAATSGEASDASRSSSERSADGDAIYVAASDLHELDPETGETNWQAHLSNQGTAAPVVTDDAVLVPSGDLCAFRRNAGGVLGPDRERWQTSSIHVAAYASPVIAAGRVFVVGPMGLLALAAGEDS